MFSCSVPDPGTGAFFTLWIRDPLWVKIKIWIQDEYPGSYFPELKNNFSGLKIPVLRIWDVYPGSKFFPSRVRIFFHPWCAPKNMSILAKKIDSELSEICSGLYILDSDPDFFTHPGS
jgi:hypothetical protein